MNPEQVLSNAERAYRKGDYDSSRNALELYLELREEGGFEIGDGDDDRAYVSRRRLQAIK